jgi:tape measure domain-containing protein
MSLSTLKIDFEASQNSLVQMKKDLDSVVKRGDKMYIKATVDIIEAKRNLDELEKKYKEVLKTKNPGTLHLVTQEIAVAQAKLKDMNQVMQETDKRLGGMKQWFSELGGFIKNALGVTALIDFWRRVFTLTSQVQQLKVGFTTLTGSQEKALELLKEIDQFAKVTPFSKMEIAKNAQMLMAFWFSAKQVIPLIQWVGNAVSAIGGWNLNEKLGRVLLQIGQIRTKWKLMQEDVSILAENGIGVWEILSKAMGKSTQELTKMWEKGQLLAKDVIPLIVSQMEKELWGNMEKMSRTLSGRLSNLQDKFEMTLAGFWSSLEWFFWAGIDLASNFVDSILPRFLALFGSIVEGWGNIFGFISDIFDKISEKSAEFTGDQVNQNASMLEKIWVLWDFFWSWLIALIQGFYGTILDYLFQFYDSIANNTLSLADVMKWAFIGAWSAIMNSIIGVMNFVISKIESVVNTGISGLNSLISLANKVPWVNIGSVGKVWFQLDYYGDGKWLFNKLSDGLKTTGNGIVWFFSNVAKNTGTAFDANLKKSSSYLWGGWGWSYKSYSSSDIAGLLWSGIWGGAWSGGSGSWAKKSKEETEALKKSVDRVKDSYTVLKNELDKIKTTSDKANAAEKKWAETIKDAHAAVEQQLKKVRTEYEKTIDTINKDSSKSTTDAVGSQYRSLLEEKKKLEKDAIDETVRLNNEAAAAWWVAHFNEYQWPEIDPKKDALGYIKYIETYGAATQLVGGQVLKDIESVNAQIKEITNSGLLEQNVKAKEDQRASLDEKWQTRFDFQDKLWEIQIEKANKISAATDEFAAKRALALKNESIIKTFENQKNARGIKLDNLKKQLDLQNQDKEQQDLIQKLYDERVSLQKAEDEKKAVETRVFQHATQLSNEYHTAEMGMIKERKAEYDTLIEKIQAAIAMAQALQRAQSSVGISSTPTTGKKFAEGGYTGDGGKYDEAGIVHKGEYVIPQHVMDSVRHIQPNILPTLERLRTWQRAMAASSQSINNSKSINLTAPIYVERPIDLHREFSKMMWRGF